MTQEPSDLKRLAREALDAGRIDEALAFADEATATDPTDADGQVLRGIALSQKGQVDAATLAFRQAIALNPISSPAYYNLAIHQFQQGQLAESRAMAQEALRLDPGSYAAKNLLENLEAKKAEVAPPPLRESFAKAPSPYYRPGYESATTGAGIEFVRKLGGTWTTIIWLLSIAFIAAFVASVILNLPMYNELVNQAMRDPNNTAAVNAIAERKHPLTDLLSLVTMLTYAGSILWAIFDILDRRTSWVWILSFVCCFPLLVPVYIFGSKR